MTIKEQIEFLEHYAAKPLGAKWDYFDGAKTASLKALVIIKKQKEALDIALGIVEYSSYESGSARIALNRINKLLEEDA